MLKKIKEYFETRRQIRALQQLNLIYMNNLLKLANDFVGSKAGFVQLVKSFEGMEAEEIRDLFMVELVKAIRESNPNSQPEQVE